MELRALGEKFVTDDALDRALFDVGDEPFRLVSKSSVNDKLLCNDPPTPGGLNDGFPPEEPGSRDKNRDKYSRTGGTPPLAEFTRRASRARPSSARNFASSSRHCCALASNASAASAAAAATCVTLAPVTSDMVGSTRCASCRIAAALAMASCFPWSALDRDPLLDPEPRRFRRSVSVLFSSSSSAPPASKSVMTSWSKRTTARSSRGAPRSCPTAPSAMCSLFSISRASRCASRSAPSKSPSFSSSAARFAALAPGDSGVWGRENNAAEVSSPSGSDCTTSGVRHTSRCSSICATSSLRAASFLDNPFRAKTASVSDASATWCKYVGRTARARVGETSSNSGEVDISPGLSGRQIVGMGPTTR
mmetsp:Transcript_5712/g.18860  ORF Transcript_5712/g.18860 Transcript_5712/m.18860 type:complete len:364 (+) Transcript_5712:2106-3197(+)